MRLVAALPLGFAVAFMAPAPAPIDAEKFDVDRSHSEIGFAIRFMGLTDIRGRFKAFGGTIMYVERDVTKSTVSVLIQAKSIDTGIDLRDNDLRGPSFFAADSFPTIFFRSERIERDGEGGGVGFVARGPLTMRGVTRDIAIPFVIAHGKMKDAWGNTRIGFVGALKLDRPEFGITGNNFWNQVVDLSRMALADTVRIELNIQAETLNYDRITFGAQPGRKPLGAALLETITARGLGAATAQYALLKRDSTTAYSVGEAQLNTLGYKLLQLGRFDDAIALFKLNVDAFPQSPNVYDSLGEAYLRKGDRANARASYDRALALDPSNVGAMEVLRWLKT
jgi:polyisoprenoid-binding protein YceI